MRTYIGIENIEDIKGKTVVTLGTFDGVHSAHRMLLERTVSKANELNARSVVITFDPHPRTFFSPGSPIRQLSTGEEKKALIENCGIDTLVVVAFDKDFAGMTAGDFYQNILLDRLNMCAMVVGYDHSFGREKENAYDFLISRGVDVERIDAISTGGITISSSSVRRAIEGGDIHLANHLLGRNYSFQGEVIHGKQLGRKLGFPTANIAIDHDHKMMPPDGVYAVRVMHNGTTYGGMMNCGMRPTLDDRLGRSVEINIFDFDKDIYGEVIQAEIIAWVRSEIKFRSLEDLTHRLKLDACRCREILKTLI